jgi:hypothetical protein
MEARVDIPAEFSIHGRDAIYGFAHAAITLKDAIARARLMTEDGLIDVTITTPTGEVYSEVDFDRLTSLDDIQISG